MSKSWSRKTPICKPFRQARRILYVCPPQGGISMYHCDERGHSTRRTHWRLKPGYRDGYILVALLTAMVLAKLFVG